jgi:hypothetical protein
MPFQCHILPNIHQIDTFLWPKLHPESYYIALKNILMYILQCFSKGFTVFSAISDTQVQCRNLQSALLRPGIVAEKIQTELAAGRFAGSFDIKPNL